MPNRQLTDDERKDLFELLIGEVRIRLKELCKDDAALHWALRRKLVKELGYDEKGKPALRKKLKRKKISEQNGLCAVCREELPEKNSVLDRFKAMDGYTEENTRLICPGCDIQIQEERGYK